MQNCSLKHYIKQEDYIHNCFLEHFIKRETKVHNCFLLKSQGTFVRQNGSISMTGLKIGDFGSEARSKTRGEEG